MAILLKEFFKKVQGWAWTVVASDINTEVIALAQAGVFSARSVDPVPLPLRERYFTMISSNSFHLWEQFQVSREIVQSVKFVHHNLLQPFEHKGFDVVFFRNVMIYYDKESRQHAVNNVLGSLAPQGYVFLSLSENLNDVSSDLKQVASSVYQRQAG